MIDCIALSYPLSLCKIITSNYYSTLYTHKGSKFQGDSGRSLSVLVLSIRFVLRGLRLWDVLPIGD